VREEAHLVLVAQFLWSVGRAQRVQEVLFSCLQERG
jgi:hypothetical protein